MRGKQNYVSLHRFQARPPRQENPLEGAPQCGWTLIRVRDWLGHSDVRQTQRYAHHSRIDWPSERPALPGSLGQLFGELVLDERIA